MSSDKQFIFAVVVLNAKLEGPIKMVDDLTSYLCS